MRATIQLDTQQQEDYSEKNANSQNKRTGLFHELSKKSCGERIRVGESEKKRGPSVERKLQARATSGVAWLTSSESKLSPELASLFGGLASI